MAQQILEFATDKKIFALTGDMGSGKTTLIKEMCRQLGSNDNFSSPTFSIVNEYEIQIESIDKRQLAIDNRSGHAPRIYHMDLYRLKNLEEALAAGIEEYLSGQNYCFVEWPELAAALLPEETVHVDLKVADGQREITIFSH